MHQREADDIACLKERLPGEHFVKDDTEAVQVRTRIEGLTGDLFRAHVARAAEHGPQRGQLGVFGVGVGF